jgi:hypothetical protein
MDTKELKALARYLVSPEKKNYMAIIERLSIEDQKAIIPFIREETRSMVDCINKKNARINLEADEMEAKIAWARVMQTANSTIPS